MGGVMILVYICIGYILGSILTMIAIASMMEASDIDVQDEVEKTIEEWSE